MTRRINPKAGEDLSSAVDVVVVYDANGDIVLPGTNPGGVPAGILEIGAAAGAATTVIATGAADVKSAAAWTAGESLTFDSGGKMRAAGTGAYVLAFAVDEATAPDQKTAIMIRHVGLSGFPVDSEGTPRFVAKGPRSSDDRPIVLPASFRGDVHVLYPGRADDVASGVRFGGVPFTATAIAEGDHPVISWGFIEWVYLTGGFVSWINGRPGDWFDFRVVAPATTGIANAGAGAFNLAPSGMPGANVFVPAPDAAGSHDLDLDERLNKSVGFSKVVPVPSTTGAGFFDWDPDTEIVTVNTAQTGGFHLFDVEIPIRRFCAELPIVRGEGERNLSPGNIKAKRLLPHWSHRVVIHDDDHDPAAPLSVCWDFVLGRAAGS